MNILHFKILSYYISVGTNCRSNTIFSLKILMYIDFQTDTFYTLSIIINLKPKSKSCVIAS